MSDKLKITYKIFLEAEDVSQSRIASCTAFVKKAFKNHKNPYINRAEFDDESDMEEFALRLYADETIKEEECANREAAEGFVDNFAELLDEIAHLHSFLDMEGAFAITYEGEALSYTFSSERGYGTCSFQETEALVEE